MKTRASLPFIAFATALLAASAPSHSAVASEARFAKIFSDHMVLQRNQPVRVWGTAGPDTDLRVTFAGTRIETAAGADGAWSVEFPPMDSGGPFELELAQGDALQKLEDILVGEVWLCSGQSNMAYRVRQMNDSDRESANPPDTIRLLTVGRNHSSQPLADFEELSGWHVASEETLAPFSAACFYFALDLQQDINVPFGLVNSSWGGSAIESWTGADGLRAIGGFDRNLHLVERYSKDQDAATNAFFMVWEKWWQQAANNGSAPWQPDFNDSDWPFAPTGLGDWQSWHVEGMADFTGMIWFRKSFELTPEQAAGGAVLELGGVDELDVSWVNGRSAGTRFGWGDPRVYQLDPGILQAGVNSVTVNVYNSWGAGGLNGPPEAIRLILADGSTVPLGDGWRYQLVPGEFGTPPKAPWESITGITGLYNAMIAPLRGASLGGALWYQGESNAGRPPAYDTLLTAMIGDWRKSLGGEFPFIIVQLPNFGELPQGPHDSGWAQLRQDQQKAAEADPLTGLVVTLDSADRTDLHPPNKRIVGERAAAVARGMLLASGEVVDGIVPLGAEREGGRVTVRFAEAGMPLRVVGAASPAGFELCSEKTGCRYVDARLENDRVVIDAETLQHANEVRYAWADAPLFNLFGAEGLPVGSFRLEIDAASE